MQRHIICLAAAIATNMSSADAGLVVDTFSSEAQTVTMTMIIQAIGQASGTSSSSADIMPMAFSRNQRVASVYYYSVNAPFNMWTSVAQARRASCVVDTNQGAAIMSMNGRLTTGSVKLDYFAKAGQVMNLTEHGNSFEIDGSLISGPVLNQAMFGSGVSVFVEVQDSMGSIARRSVINETGSELNQTLRFDFSMFNSVAMSSVERLSVGFEYGGNPYFDTELIYYPPEYRLNSISIVPTPAASALLLAGGLLARRRRN